MARFLLHKKLSSTLQSLNCKVLPSILLERKCGSAALLWHGLSCLSSYSGSEKFDLTDLTRPHTWYPNARSKKRNVFLHVGPTNSGKTYTALKRLESSSSGVYCGPLRLLAWEVAKRLNKANVPCNLITGQERDEIDGAMHNAVTVEMVDVTAEYQCAIIDEIQMVACKTRGYAFTRALLGICSDELHICGDPAAVPLIQRILEVTDDVVQVDNYERLSPLVPSKTPLGSFSNIQTGDCIVTFSRREIYKLKKQIEDGGKHLCSVVYGSLPPETRTKQIQRSNTRKTRSRTRTTSPIRLRSSISRTFTRSYPAARERPFVPLSPCTFVTSSDVIFCNPQCNSYVVISALDIMIYFVLVLKKL